MGVIFQVICTLIICYQCMMLGIVYTWPSSTLMIFSSPNTTLNRIMTEGEVALLGSLSSVGALISTPIAGVFLDRLGRKPCSIISSLTATVSWAIISLSSQVELVLTAIFFSGFSGAIFLISTAYICEFCQENIRGTMASCVVVFYALGMLVSYIFGGYLSYHVMVYVILTMSIVAVLSLFFLKESPLFLMSKGREQEAAKTIAFYRSTEPNSKEVLNEMENIRRSLNPELDDETPEEERLKPEMKMKKKLTLIQFLKKSSSTRRAIVVALTLMSASIFQGLPVLQVYAQPLFEEAVSVMSSNLCSIIFAVINTVFGVLAAYLCDAAGRKPLVIYGSIASGLCCLLLGSQIHVNWGPGWLTALAIYLYCVVYMLGAGTVPYVIIGEVFLPEVKSFMTMLVVQWNWLCNFLILLIFNPLVSCIGLGPVFYIFACVCFLTAVFSFFFQPETKGLTVDAIQQMFTKKKSRQHV